MENCKTMLTKTVGSHKKSDAIFYQHIILTNYSITLTLKDKKKAEAFISNLSLHQAVMNEEGSALKRCLVRDFGVIGRVTMYRQVTELTILSCK